MAWSKRVDKVADEMTGMTPKKKGWSDEAREAAKAERGAKSYLKSANANIMAKSDALYKSKGWK
jgi:hypothetical protein